MKPKSYLCFVCGREYEPKQCSQKYCSKACKNRADKNDRRFSGSRQYVLDRDGNACVKCGSNRGLIVHHKDKSRFNNNPSNLETLCRSCHAKVHYLDTWVVKPETRECVVCGGKYHPIQKNQKLCRRKACLVEWKKLQKRANHEAVKCAVCGNEFIQKHSNHITCSSECRHEYDKRKKRNKYYADRDVALVRQKRYYEAHKEQVKAYVTKWRKANPDKVAAYYGKS